MLNYAELKASIGTILQRGDDTAYLTKIGVWVNQAQQHLYNVYDYWSELQGIHLFDTVNGTEDYPMPSDLGKPFRVYNMDTNTRLKARTEYEYVDSNISNIAETVKAAPTFFRVYGVHGVTTQIASTGATVKAQSSSTADVSTTDSPLIVRVEGYIDSAMTVLDFENITLNGTTFVAGTKTFYKILHVSKSADTTGYVTLANSAGTTLSILSSIERVAYHQNLKLGLIPDDAYSMRVLFKKMVRKMVNDYDYPFVEADDFITHYASAMGFAQSKEGLEYAAILWKRSGSALAALLVNAQNKLGAGHHHRFTNVFARAHRS